MLLRPSLAGTALAKDPISPHGEELEEAMSGESWVDTQTATGMEFEELVKQVRNNAKLSQGAVRVLAGGPPPLQLRLLSAGATQRKENVVWQLKQPPRFGYRPMNEDAFGLVGEGEPQEFQFKHSDINDLGGLPFLVADGGANAVCVADGVGGVWAEHGVSSGLAAQEAVRVFCSSVRVGNSLMVAMEHAHAAVTDPDNEAADGTIALAAYQLSYATLSVMNVGDCHVFVFIRDAADGKWRHWHDAGVLVRIGKEAGPKQFGKISRINSIFRVDLGHYVPREQTVKPGDVVLAMSDGIYDCLAHDLPHGSATESELAVNRIATLVQENMDSWPRSSWSAENMCIKLVEVLMQQARQQHPDLLNPAPRDYKDKRFRTCGSHKPDDLTIVASLVLNAADNADAKVPPT